MWSQTRACCIQPMPLPPGCILSVPRFFLLWDLCTDMYYFQQFSGLTGSVGLPRACLGCCSRWWLVCWCMVVDGLPHPHVWAGAAGSLRVVFQPGLLDDRDLPRGQRYKQQGFKVQAPELHRLLPPGSLGKASQEANRESRGREIKFTCKIL